MKNDNSNALAFEEYQLIADAYAHQLEAKPINKLYERPAVLSLLPDLTGKQVLDLGCGPGVYSSILLQRKAHVIGIDYSPAMLALARERLGPNVPLYNADISKPLPFLSDESFDIVLAALVLHYIEDWSTTLRECARVLKPEGIFVASIDHPLASALRDQTHSYFKTTLRHAYWPSYGIHMPYFSRSLTASLQPFLDAHFAIEKIIEPQATQELKSQDPKTYEQAIRYPLFLCIRAKK